MDGPLRASGHGDMGRPAVSVKRMADVDFYFDVMCPWAYQTSKWIREARLVRDITVHWRFFSLEEVNRQEGKKHPWERAWSYGWSMLRVAALCGGSPTARRGRPFLPGGWRRAARAGGEGAYPDGVGSLAPDRPRPGHGRPGPGRCYDPRRRAR